MCTINYIIHSLSRKNVKRKVIIMKKQYIIDCDPGLDDAIALLVAMQSEDMDIRAITTVGGNSSVDMTAENALRLVDYAGFDIKVAKGAKEPILGKLEKADYVHGKTGLGNVELPEAKKSLYEKTAYETIYEEAIKCKGNLRLIATGPLTNIALTFMMYPDIKELISHITIMGGAVDKGNISPSAEANIYNDPEAAKIVFEAGIPMTMCGLDVTHKALIFDEDIKKIREIGNDMSKIAGDFMEFHASFHKIYEFEGDPIHDACAVAFEIDPSLFKTRMCHVDIETKGDYTRGRTVADYYNVLHKDKNVEVVLDIDRERFAELIYNSIKKYR